MNNMKNIEKTDKADKMNSNDSLNNIESIRACFLSFISTPITNLTSRQKDAVKKMLFLEHDQFQDLLVDIQDEIKRRQSHRKDPLMKSDTFSFKRNKSRQNLSRLNGEKFDNLVIDVLLVLNHRYSIKETGNEDEIECLIDDLERLIRDLKGDMAYEQLVIEQIKKERDLKLRLHIYNKYVRRLLEKYNEDVSVVDCVEELLRSEVESESVTLHDLMDTNVFLKQCEKYFSKFNVFAEEYEYHKGNIVTLVDETIFSQDVHEKLIRKEKKSLFELMLKTDKKMKKSDKSIEEEVNTIICTLGTIRDLLKCGVNEEYFTVARNAVEAVDSLSKKLTGINNAESGSLIEAREDLMGLIKEKNGEGIPLSIFNMASLVKTILYNISVNGIK